MTSGSPGGGVIPVSWSGRLTDVSIWLLVVMLAVPETLFPDEVVRIAGIPAYSACTALLVGFLVMEVMCKHHSQAFLLILVIVASMGLMALVGLMHNASVTDIGRDSLYLSAFLAGILYGTVRQLNEIWSFALKLAIFSVLASLLTIAAFEAGLLAARGGIDAHLAAVAGFRTSIGSIGKADANILIVLPFVFLLQETSEQRSRWIELLYFTSISYLILVGFWSSTKGCMLQAAFLVIIWIRRSLSRTTDLTKLCLLLLFVAIALILGYDFYRSAVEDTLLYDRATGYDLGQDGRIAQAQGVLDSLSGYEWTGLGLGVQYVTYYAGERLAVEGFVPDMGAFIFLVKGGVFLFCICVVAPVCAALYGMVSPRTPFPAHMAVSAGILGYAVIGFGGHGGAFHGDLFLYGIMVACLATLTFSSRGSNRPTEPLFALRSLEGFASTSPGRAPERTSFN